jgi:hypothetical protein
MIYEKPKNEIFASDAKDGEIVDFPNIKRGWGVTENLGFIPPMEYFNAAFNRVDKSLAYQLQRGVGEWDKDLEYPIGAVVSLNGIIYIAKSQNINKNPANEATIWDIVATQKWCEELFVKKAKIKDSLPTGAYVLYSSNSNTPDGFLRCDGSALDKTTYAALFAVVGYTYGRSGDKFLLPNFSDGKFMRSIGGNAAALGASQPDAIRNITGEINTSAEDIDYKNPVFYNNGRYDAQGAFEKIIRANTRRSQLTQTGTSQAWSFDASRVVPTANENRPLNMAVVVLIKY